MQKGNTQNIIAYISFMVLGLLSSCWQHSSTELLPKTPTDIRVETGFEEDSVVHQETTFIDLPICQATAKIYSRIDLLELDIQVSDYSISESMSNSNRLLLSQINNGITRIITLEKKNDESWSILIDKQLPYEVDSVKLSPFGRYIGLSYTKSAGSYVGLFDIDRNRFFQENLVLSSNPIVYWSFDEQFLFVPIYDHPVDSIVETEMVEIFDTSTFSLIKTLHWPNDEKKFLLHWFWINPTNNNQFIFRTYSNFYYYNNGNIGIITGLPFNDLFSNVDINWINNEKYYAGYRELLKSTSDNVESTLIKLGLFDQTDQLAEYIIVFDNNYTYIYNLKGNIEEGGITISTSYYQSLLRFSSDGQDLQEPCQIPMKKLIDPAYDMYSEEKYEMLNSRIINDDLFFITTEDEIIFYHITWEP